MKNKAVYSFILVFLISLLSSARITKGTCGSPTVCSQIIKKCNEVKNADKDELELPLGLFLFNI